LKLFSLPYRAQKAKEASSGKGRSGTRRVVSKAAGQIFNRWENKWGFLPGEILKRIFQVRDAHKIIKAAQKRS